VACGEREPPGEDPVVVAPDAASHAPWFTDITGESGLDFVHGGLADERLHMPAVMGGGAAMFDYDDDGDLDLYLTSGYDAVDRGPLERASNRLYRREADGRYVDATAASGLGDPGYGMGVAVGDIDNDGDLDVFVTNYGADRLYLNRGDGSFSDVTESAGAGVEGWSASAAFCDFDRDGFLDLYVTRYVDYQPPKRCSGKDGRPDFCGPNAFRDIHDVVLRNETGSAGGEPRFADVSSAAGIDDTFAAGLGVVCLDADGDGWQDVYVANDADPNQLWTNLGGGPGTIRFRDDSLVRGVAYNLHGQAQAGMGIIAEDLDGSGTPDLFLTHLMNEANTLYSNLGGAAGFQDTSGAAGLGPTSMRYTGFGVVAFDAELDGDLDLFIANGKVNVDQPVPGSGHLPPWNTLPESNLFHLNDGSGKFTRADEVARGLVSTAEISRGVASGDIDGDGDIDLLVANLLDRARLYRNDAPRQGHWLAVRAIDPDLNRDALGARVTLVMGQRRMGRDVVMASGYLSSQSPQVHFGLGPAAAVDHIQVRWPDGSLERFPGMATDQAITLQRGSGEPAGG
jgi:hypothetical protein